MNVNDVLQEFKDLLHRELSEYETRMITRAYILGLANGVSLASKEMEGLSSRS